MQLLITLSVGGQLLCLDWLILSKVVALQFAVLADVELPLMLPPIVVYLLILSLFVFPSVLSMHPLDPLLLVALIRDFVSTLRAVAFDAYVLMLILRAFTSA